jgi:hypothetical protein
MPLPTENQTGPQADQGTANYDTKISQPSIPPAFVENHVPPSVHNDDKTSRDKSCALEKRKFIVAVITLLLLFAYTSIAAYQACLTRSAIRDSKDSFRKTLKQMKDQTTAQQVAANASKSAAETSDKALGASISATHLDQRPWVVWTGSKLSEEPQIGKEFTIICWIINTGKTPAIDVVPISKVLIWHGEPPPTHFGISTKGALSRSILAPGTGTGSKASFTTDSFKLDAQQIDAYRRRQSSVYVHAKVFYTDTFDDLHWTTICISHEFGMPLDSFSFCEKGNDVDHK